MPDDLLGFCGDPAANEIARQGGFISDQLYRADRRVERIASEWREVCDQLVIQRDNAVAGHSAAVAAHNELAARFDQVVADHKDLEADLAAMRQERDHARVYGRVRDRELAEARAEIDRLSRENASLRDPEMQSILVSIRETLNAPVDR